MNKDRGSLVSQPSLFIIPESHHLRCLSPDVSGGPLANGGDDQEIVEEEEKSILARPRAVGHGHEVVLDQGASRGAQVVGTQTLDGQLQLAQDLKKALSREWIDFFCVCVLVALHYMFCSIGTRMRNKQNEGALLQLFRYILRLQKFRYWNIFAFKLNL